MFRIGGEFEIGPNDFLREKLFDKQNLQFNFPFVQWVDTGRSAILLALELIVDIGGKKEAWLPIFCCSSVIQPFIQKGFKINFYSMGLDLQTPDYLPNNLKGLTILFINYFGITNKLIKEWLLNHKDYNECYIIEDNVQASLNFNIEKNWSFSVYSFRKFLSQPDGAVLASKISSCNKLMEPNESFISKKIVGKIIRENNGNPELFLDLFNMSEKELDRDVTPRKMSWVSSYLFERTDLKFISKKRRNNWKVLDGIIKEEKLNEYIFPLFKEMGKGEVPLGFPIKVNSLNRDSLRKHLMKFNIFCPIHWIIPETKVFCEDYRLSQSILTIPIDQRIEQEHLYYLIDKLKSFFNSL